MRGNTFLLLSWALLNFYDFSAYFPKDIRNFSPQHAQASRSRDAD